MSVANSYLVLNDKNIKKLEERFNLDIDDIFYLAKNAELNLYIRVETVNERESIIRTEFDEYFNLSGFVNGKGEDRVYKDFFSLADYNMDFLKKDDRDAPFGFIYNLNDSLSDDEPKKQKDKLTMVCFDGFIQIPSRCINESLQRIVLDKFSPYYFLQDEYGKKEPNFVLNFSFPNKSVQVPIQNTYILMYQLSEVVADELNSIQLNNKKDEEIAQLKLDNAELRKQVGEQDKIIEKLQKKTGSKASDNKKNAFIKSLLYIHYGSEVAENPRSHIYDPNSSDKGMNGRIQVDFDRNGLAKHLPTGRTINDWVKTIELDIS